MTKESIAAAIQVVQAVAETIRELKRIPAGHLYAQLMGQGCTLQQFERITGILIGSGKVRKDGDELVWVD